MRVQFLTRLFCLFYFAITIAVTACVRPSETTKITFAFPTNSSQSGYDYTLDCYAVNVTGAGMTTKAPGGACAIPLGVFKGFAPSGATIEVENVLQGTARKIEVFSYQRTSTTQSCSSVLNMASMDPSTVHRVGTTIADVLSAAPPAITVTVGEPSTADTLVSLYGVSASCLANNTTLGTGTSKVVLGAGTLGGTGYKAIGVVTDHQGEALLSGGNFKIRMSRVVQ